MLTTGVVGWQAGFIGGGIAAGLAAISLFFLLKDRPQTYGLHEPAVVFEKNLRSPIRTIPRKPVAPGCSS